MSSTRVRIDARHHLLLIFDEVDSSVQMKGLNGSTAAVIFFVPVSDDVPNLSSISAAVAWLRA